jgi:hypothetical protein
VNTAKNVFRFETESKKGGSRVMKKRNALTLVEVLVVISILLFLIVILIPAFERRPGPHRTIICLSNLKQLSLAWVMYADDNDSDLVNGMAGIDRVDNSTSPPTILERAWIRPIPLDNGNPTIDRRTQEQKIKAGALWEYLKNPKIYHCPAGKINHLVTYQIVDSMNGFQQPDTVAEGVWASKREDISKPGDKIVFIDIGKVRSSSYHVSYRDAKWLDMPPVRHRDGATVSFADAHSVYWKWKGHDTISFGRNDKRSDGEHQPTSPEGKEDLQKLQGAVWGKLGYGPEPQE